MQIFRSSFIYLQLFCFLMGALVALASDSLLAQSLQTQPSDPDYDKFDIELLDLGKTYWHGIYIGDKKSGYMRSGFERRGAQGGKPIIASVTKTELKLLVQGRQTVMSTLEVAEFETEKPYRMIGGYSSTQNQLGRTTIKSTVQDGTLTAQINESGKQRTKTVNDFKYTLPQVAAFALMDFDEAKSGDKFGFSQFALGDLTFDEQTVEFLGSRNSLIDGVQVKFYETDVTSGTHKTTGRFRFGAERELLSAVIGGVFEMRVEPESQARNFDFSADLSVLGVIRLNQSIGNPKRVKALELSANQAIANAIKSGPMQKVERTGGGYSLKLGRKHGVPTSASQAEIDEHLQETVDYPINDANVRNLVQQAIGGETDVRKKIQKLIPFVSRYLDDTLDDNAISVLDIIQRKRGDCTEHAKLFATLARAARIPAREVGGFIYLGDDTRAFGAHAWNEVVIDGTWWPVDPMWNETNINATHIQLNDQSQLFSLGSTLQLLNVER